MKKILLLSLILISAIGCKKDELNDVLDPVNNVEYQLKAVSGSNMAGEVTFTRNTDNSTTVYIRLTNPTSPIHPAAIHHNSMSEGGELAISLNACDCEESTTFVTTMDDGTPITFDEMRNFDGHLNIYMSETENEVIVSQADIGSNKFK